MASAISFRNSFRINSFVSVVSLEASDLVYSLDQKVFDDDRGSVVDDCPDPIANSSVNRKDSINLVCIKKVNSKFHVWSILCGYLMIQRCGAAPLDEEAFFGPK